MRAYNSTNENGAYSNVVSATTFSNPPTAPSALTATAASASQINLAWTDNSSDETGFKIERSTDGGATWTQIATVGVEDQDLHQHRPRCRHRLLLPRQRLQRRRPLPLPTNTATATTWAAMPPTTVTATVLSSTSIRVNWIDASSNETGFKLEASAPMAAPPGPRSPPRRPMPSPTPSPG